MDISKIKVGNIPDKINAVIEIPYGSSVKYELDKESGAVFVDRIMVIVSKQELHIHHANKPSIEICS